MSNLFKVYLSIVFFFRKVFRFEHTTFAFLADDVSLYIDLKYENVIESYKFKSKLARGDYPYSVRTG